VLSLGKEHHHSNVITDSRDPALKADTPCSMYDPEEVFNFQNLHFHTCRMGIIIIMAMILKHLQDWNGCESRHTEKAELSA